MNTKTINNQQFFDRITPTWIFYIVIAIGAILRLVALKSDPPLDLAKGQSLWTDPSQYVFFARNLVAFGRMDSFIPSGLVFFKYSFISFLSIPLFFIFNPGYWQSNLVSSIISIAMIFIFCFTIKKAFGYFTGTIAAIFGSISYIFVMHNRVPYLENASIFFLSISTYFLILKYENKNGLLLSGIFLACALLIGKTLAVLVIPAYIIAIYIVERNAGNSFNEYFKKLINLFIGFAIFAVFALAVFYLPNYMASREYLAENVVNYYGFPDGLKSIGGFIKSLYSFDLINFENSFFDRIPIISILSLLALVFIRIKKRKPEEERALLFIGIWLIGGLLFLSPWNYRPIRYEMYLVLPMIGLAAILLRELIVSDIDLEFKKVPWVVLIVSLITFHIYYNLSHENQNGLLNFWKIFLVSMLISIIISLALKYIVRGIKLIKPEIRYFGVIFIILIALFLESKQYINWNNKLTYAIDYANKCIERELNINSVIMGPYAQTLTLGTSIKAEIFYFGAYPKNDSLFERIPATHVLYEVGMGGSKSGNETKFAEYYSKVNAGSELVDSYLIGRYYVNLYNIVSGTDNYAAKSYRMTDFEKGMYFYNRNNIDSALIYFTLAEKLQHAVRAFLYKGNIYYRQGNYELAKVAYAKGLEDNCYDPKYWALYSISCKQMGDMRAAEIARDNALKYAPFPGYFQNVNF